MTAKLFTLIDPAQKTLTRVPLDLSKWENIAPAIDADLFELVRLRDGTMLFVDESGMYRQPTQFLIEGYGAPLLGKAIHCKCFDAGLDTERFEPVETTPKVTWLIQHGS